MGLRLEAFPLSFQTYHTGYKNPQDKDRCFPSLPLPFKNKSICCLSYREHSNKERVGLSKENLLLRGCTIRNTEAVVGIVVYAGSFSAILYHVLLYVSYVLACFVYSKWNPRKGNCALMNLTTDSGFPKSVQGVTKCYTAIFD